MTPKKILIVGGVAAGATAAARSRRLDERARIIVFERGPHVSFANCGLPYHLGGVIADESALLLSSPEQFQEKFDIEVRVLAEVLAIDRDRREIRVRDRQSGREYVEAYDALLLAPGARPVRPPVPGLDLPGVFTLRTVPDVRRVREWIEQRGGRRAVVVGAGFIGLEVTENLVRLGLAVEVLEAQQQVFTPLDREVAEPLATHLEQNGVRLHLAQRLEAIASRGDGDLEVVTSAGQRLPTDLVILALGVRPEADLASGAGLAVGRHGGVVVDASMQTSDPHVWAAGDVVEHTCFVTEDLRTVPLAGLANRQGRTAADSIAGRRAQLRGMQGTFVCELFGLTVAGTGVTEKHLAAMGGAAGGSDGGHTAVWLHPKHHVTYYPGAEAIHLKLVYSTVDGRVLGAQAVGRRGVDKRIDVIAMAMQMGATVYDLEQAELAYSPQFGAAKDPVNLAGMVAANQLRGDVQFARWEALPPSGARGAVLVDVRESTEYATDHVPGATNVPLASLRARSEELPRDRELWLYCETGKRSYDAARVLTQRGFRVRALPGGIQTWRQLGAPLPVAAGSADPGGAAEGGGSDSDLA